MTAVAIKPLIQSAQDLAVKGIKKMPVEAYLIPIISACQIYDDAKNAEQSERTNVILKDITVLAGSIAGVAAACLSVKALLNKGSKSLINDLIRYISIPIGGLIAGIGAGEIAEAMFPTQNLKLKKDVQAAVNKTILENPKEITSKVEEPKEKKKEHKYLKTFLVVAATCAGLFGGNRLADKAIMKFNLLNPNNVLSIAGILCGGFVANLLSAKIFNKIFPETSTVDKVSESIQDVSSTYSMVGNADIFGNTFFAMNGFNIGREKGFASRVKRGCSEILSNVLLPAALIVPVAKILLEKIEEGKINPLQKIVKDSKLRKTITQKLFILPLTFGGIYLGNIVGKWFDKRFTEKVVQNELWIRINQKRDNLIQNYIRSSVFGDEQQKQLAALALEKIQNIEESVKMKAA